jgi:hypothetical protein
VHLLGYAAVSQLGYYVDIVSANKDWHRIFGNEPERAAHAERDFATNQVPFDQNHPRSVGLSQKSHSRPIRSTRKGSAI